MRMPVGPTCSRTALALVLALVLLGGACACAPEAAQGTSAGAEAPAGAAAMLADATPIREDDVTSYIEDYRAQIGAEGDEDWARIMEGYAFGAETLREMTIYELAAKQVMAQAAQEAGIEVADSDVEQALDAAKSAFDVSSDEAWTSLIDLYGSDEQSVAENTRYRLLEYRVYQHYVPQPEVSDDQVAAFMAGNYAGVEAHLAQCVSFGTDRYEVAQQVESLIADRGSTPEVFAQAVQLYSDNVATDDPEGLLEWDVVYGLDSDIYALLDGAAENQLLADLYPLGNGEHALLFCREVYRIPEQAPDLATVPAGLVAYMRGQAQQSAWTAACKAWLQQRIESQLTIYDMPEGLPYA